MRRMSDLRQEIENERFRLTAAKNATSAYLLNLKELFDQQRDYLSRLSELTAPASPPPDPVETVAAEIEGSVHKLLAGEDLPQQREPDEDMEDTKELDMGDLHDEADPDKHPPSFAAQRDPVSEDREGDSGEVFSSARRIDFDNLQFGKDYEIK